MVPPALEGPVIAEFVAQDLHRPEHYLLRPGKEFAHADWFGRNYSAAVATPEEMMQYFRRSPVNLLIWNERPDAILTQHRRIMSEMLRSFPACWHSVLSLAPEGNPASSWTVYEYRAAPGNPR
jgi:hypothetical protein